MRLVILESPFAGCWLSRWRNVRYASECMKDSLSRGEAPLASHLLYAYPEILNDNVPVDRERGIQCGFAWATAADATVVYEDFGISEGMKRGIHEAEMCGRPVEYRSIKP